ncbi:MAG: copper amine oxidase N-terminal domain-containing protein [Oscillospiraceae bacterium]|nr:copper amine oxidase N-terminal domain-containing protein [Oscillospiraceae bacterium]
MKRKLTAMLLMIAMLCSIMPFSVTASPGAAAAAIVAGARSAAPVDTGVKLSWDAVDGAAGYTLSRSKGASTEPIITDGPITATSYVDVEVDANTEYTYSCIPVMADGSSSGDDLATVSVTTGASILGGEISEMVELGIAKGVILMKVDDPDMSVNGATREIDPGRGTAPIIVSSRTLVPIRAIIEAMGGTVGWEDATQKITLNASGHNVEMWLDKTELIVDGATKTMDVAPTAINDRTMVPVRFAAENVGCAVGWIEATSEIVIVYYEGGTPPGLTPGPGPAPTPTPAPGPGPGPAPDPTPTPAPATPGGGLGNGPVIKTTYSMAELTGIIASVEALLRDEPTGGRVIPDSELYALLDQYRKHDGSGDVWYNKDMNGLFEKSGGRWFATSADLSERWSKSEESRSDTLFLKDNYSPELEGTVDGRIYNEDANYYYSYWWTHGDSTGTVSKYDKRPDSDYIPGGTFDIEVTRYDDAVIDGQECIVYSYNYETGYDSNYTTYYWFSKSKGHDILMETFYSGDNSIHANFTYIETMVGEDRSKFDTTRQGVSVWEEVSSGA